MNKLKILFIVLLFLLPLAFFKDTLLQAKLPIPSDTIVGLYYPFRDAFFKTNPNGLPYKNALITDPVRQQIPWKTLVIEAEKKLQLPLWNPYNFAGAPLLANFQSSVFYPLNLLFLILPFTSAWSLLVFSGPLLAGLFLFLYLSNLKLNKYSSLFGAVTFAFCGFSIAWMEWGTIISTALWLPLILLSIDKIFEFINHQSLIINRKTIGWCLIFLASMVSSFFAGHLQTFFYLAILTTCYLIFRWFQYENKLKNLGMFCLISLIAFILILPQLIPTLQFIAQSARNVDIVGWKDLGWFIPWQNLIQFISPDFFGNPATLNYYGIWNYGEFIGYIGIAPLIMAFFALLFRRDKKTLFFGLAFILSLVFALPTILAKIPFKFDIPFISTAQPTRLLFIADFSLSILAAFGLDHFINSKNRKLIITVLGFFAIIFISLWSFVMVLHGQLLTIENLAVAKQNLIFPTILFIVSSAVIVFWIFLEKKTSSLIINLLPLILISIVVVDLFRFGWKFEPFTNKAYLFPSTAITSFLQNQKGVFRVMATDSKILPPNFSVMYKLQTLDGYDPLYLRRYGELMAAVGRLKPDISTPFGFYRIITPNNFTSRITDLLGVKYILSLEEIRNAKLKQVFTDGYIRIYENEMAMPRAFFVDNILIANSKQQAIDAMFDVNYPPNGRAVVENIQNKQLFKTNWSIGTAQVIDYESDKVVVDINNPGDGFLVLTDSYYYNWHAKIDGKETTIYLTDYNFRGIITPKGKHTIVFYDTMF
jgi:hypothetical protein